MILTQSEIESHQRVLNGRKYMILLEGSICLLYIEKIEGEGQKSRQANDPVK